MCISDVERMRQVGKRKTKPIRRCDAKPGMVFISSHGYRLLITEVSDTSMNRTDTDARNVEIKGHLHANPDAPIRGERYPANSIIHVEIEKDSIAAMDAWIAAEQAFDRERAFGCALTDLNNLKLDALGFDGALGEERR